MRCVCDSLVSQVTAVSRYGSVTPPTPYASSATRTGDLSSEWLYADYSYLVISPEAVRALAVCYSDCPLPFLTTLGYPIVDWDSTSVELAQRAWIGDCAFQCESKADCKSLESDFPGMKFCCSAERFCSTNCYSQLALTLRK